MSAEDTAAVPRIFVDADACPNAIKDILFRAAERTPVEVVLVANQWIRVPPSRHIRSLQVNAGLDVADSEIVRRCIAGDLVVTADIPLAARVLEKGALALNPRGELYTPDTIAERLAMRNFMDGLRGAGIATDGPPALHARDRQAFANALDRWLTQRRT
ncbi:YaiI/YqxD family protein [Dokdonella sp.]|uniref:YaiI/YqxD family protein n=1 Tax=Dokdonella sp. TaxID=2291710 RepID=UPI0025BB79C1|nr:YaiI/YqxD family protein [Dokdonella sp.]MBX3693143.1 YaiI/YqxD family protein [Dokdonella sp.]MCW5567484.1 YaiI/YqxD family protein [Dokdonella sp.]